MISITSFFLPNCWNKRFTLVWVIGSEGLIGGWRAWRSLAPILNRTWGPPAGGTCIHPNMFPTNVSNGIPRFSTYTV